MVCRCDHQVPSLGSSDSGADGFRSRISPIMITSGSAGSCAALAKERLSTPISRWVIRLHVGMYGDGNIRVII